MSMSARPPERQTRNPPNRNLPQKSSTHPAERQHNASASASASASTAGLTTSIPPKMSTRLEDDDIEQQQRREQASHVLASWEMLALYAVARGESIPQTRLRFEKHLCGLSDSTDEWTDEVDESWDSAASDGSNPSVRYFGLGESKEKTGGSGGSGGGSGSGSGSGSGKGKGKDAGKAGRTASGSGMRRRG